MRIELKYDRYKPYLALIINPKQLVSSTNYTDIISPDDNIDEVFKMIDEMLLSYFGEGLEMNSMALSRIDYCVNMKLSDKNEVKQYIKLLYKTGAPRGYSVIGKLIKGYDESRSFTAVNENDGTELSVYDKEAQLDDINKPSESAANILRIELRLTRESTVDRYTKGCNEVTDKIKMCMAESRKNIVRILSKVVMDADYHTLDNAEGIVKTEVEKDKLRERMLLFLRLV